MSLSRRFIGGNVGINTTNPTSTLDVSGTARITTSITSGALYATNSTITNVVGTTISVGTILATTFTGVSMGLSGDLVIGGTLTTVNITTTNVVDTNITSSNMNVTALATITNANITIGTVGTLINTNLVSSNTSSGTMNLSTGLTTGTILATTSISSGVVNATNSTVTNSVVTSSTVTNIVVTNVSSGTLNLSTGLTTGTILATTSISSGVVNATNSTVTNSVVTSSTVTNIVVTNVSSGTLNLSTGLTSASAQITNSNVTTQTVGTVLVTTNLLATGSSNTLGNIFTTGGSVGIGTTSPATDNGSRLSIVGSAFDSSGILRLYPSTFGQRAVIGFHSGQTSGSHWTIGRQNVSNEFALSLSTNMAAGMYFFENGNVSCGPLTTTSLTTGTILATTSISSGVVNATNSTMTNSVVTSNTVGTSRITTSLLAIGNSNTVGNIFTTGGNVGIGTSDPSYKLDVSGNFRARSDNAHSIGHSTTDTRLDIFACHRRGVATGGWVSFDPNGGTTGSSGLHVYDGLDVSGSVTTGSLNVNGTIQTISSVNASQSIVVQNTNSGSSAYSILTLATDQSNFNIFKNSSTRTADGGANTTTIRNDGGPLRLQSNTGLGIWVGSTGNVGINTTTPSAILNVNGDSTGSNGSLLITGTDSFGNSLHIASQASHKRLGFNHNGTIGNIFSYDYATGPQNLILQYPGGNVGIGTTSPSAKLHVLQSSNSDAMIFEASANYGTVLQLKANATNGRTFKLQSTASADGSNPGGAFIIDDGTAGARRFVINSTGDIGINTASPTAKLNVSGSTDLFGNLRVGSNSSSTGFNIDLGTNGVGTYRSGYLYGDGTTIYLTNQQVGGLNFGTNNTWDRMVITAAGNVGVGTGSPSVKLHVVGGDLGVPYGQCIRASPESASVWPSGTTKMIETGWDINGFSGDILSIYTPGSASSTTKINITSSGIINLNGNVGIGIASPTSKLQVYDAVSSIIKVSGPVAGEQGFNITDTASRWSIYKPGNTTDLRFFNGSTDIVSFANAGRVTINGVSGSYPLTVFGSSNSGSVGGYAGWYNVYNWQVQTTSYDVSIYGQNFIMAGQGFVSVSDQRIKKDIVDIEDGESLSILRQIQPKRYRYIDEYKRGTDYVYGFIAQQVRGVLPSASGLVKDFIPSIMTLATVSYDSTNDITTVTLVDNKQHNLTSENSNSRVRFFDENDQNTDLELHEIVSGDIFKVKGELKGVNTFVYGVEVDDFHTLNKDAIFTVALAALQQVDKELQETKQTVNDLSTDLQKTRSDLQQTRSDLQQTVNDLLQRIQALENPA